MSFVVKEVDVVRLVLGYLKGNGCYEAHNALALEAEQSFDNLPKSLLYLQKLVYQGKWQVVLRYLDTLKTEITAPEVLNKLEYFVHRQKYLELLSWQGGGEQRLAFPPWKPNSVSETFDMEPGRKTGNDVESNIEMSILVKELNTLKGLCSAAEFNGLCAFLTLDRLESHPDYQHWTVAQGRWTCFSELSRILVPILASDEHDATQYALSESSDVSQGLLKTIAMSLAYQTALALDRPFSESHHEQTAEFNHTLGYISPACDPSGDYGHGKFDDKSTPSLVVQSPLQVKQRFDAATALPHVDPAKVDYVHRISTRAQSKESPGRVAAVHKMVPSPPRHGTDTEHHLKLSAVAAPPLHVPTEIHQQESHQHNEMYPANMPPTYIAPAPAGMAPGGGGYMYVLPPGYAQNPNVFGFMPGPVPGSFVPQMMPQMAGPQVVSQQQVPFPMPISVAQPSLHNQRLSIEVGDGQRTEQAWTRPQSGQQQPQSQRQQQPGSVRTPNTNALTSQPAKQAASSSARNQPSSYDHAPLDPFTPQAVALPTNYFQPQTAYSYNPTGQQGHPSDYQQPYPAPHSITHASPHAAHVQPSHVNVAVRSEPTDAHPHGKIPAWTAGQEVSSGPASSSTQGTGAPGVQRPNTDVVVAPPAAFTVPVLDEAKVKQMPAALRRKMEADKEAAALAAEERQQESLQAERAASRGRSRSAPRGNAAAVPVTIVTPATAAGRPQSAVRARGGSAAPELQPSAPSTGRNNGTNAAVDVRKSSETAISKFSQQSQPSQAGGSVRSGGGASRIPMAAPLSVQSKDVPSSTGPSQQRPREAAPALPAEKVNYSAHLIYESKCPLRCVSVLGGGPARTQFAVGSNAKAIIAMSFARGEIEAQRSVQASVMVDRELAGVHSGSVYCMDYHAGLGLIASGSNDKAIRFCSPTTGQCGEPMKEHTGTIRAVKFLSEHSSGSAGSALLASAGAGDCKPRLWDAQAGRFVRALSEHPDAVHGLAWVNENLFVTGCDAGVVVGHDLRSSRPAWSYSLSDALPPGAGAQKGICCLSLLGAGSSSSSSSVPMVAGGLGGFVTIFNAATGQIFSHEKLHSDDVRSVCVSPATARVRGELSVDMLTGSYDSTAALWRVTLDNNLRIRYEGSPRVLSGHTDKVLSVVPFFAGGRSAPDVLTTGADGKVILWTLS